MGNGGYIREFIEDVWKPLQNELTSKNIKVITNAGGMNPLACKKEIEEYTKKHNLRTPTIAAIEGDNITDHFKDYFTNNSIKTFVTEGKEDDLSILKSTKLLSANAYLGAFPIAKALDLGAEIVITGRCVDSALVLGALIHEFNWKETDFIKLASGSLGGHLIECGTQCCGGNFTDWETSLAGGWTNVGFPIIECKNDGTFTLTKPNDTGGIVNIATVSEQLVYEIMDPSNYILPDVIADFSHVRISPNKVSNSVKVTDASGKPPTNYYKISLTYADGWKSDGTIMIGGVHAVKKARAVGEAIIANTNQILSRNKIEPIKDYQLEFIGAEHSYGKHSKALDAREVCLRISVRHPERKALLVFAKEVAPSATSMAPGIYGGGSGRPSVVPFIGYRSCLIRKSQLVITIYVGEMQPITLIDKEFNGTVSSVSPKVLHSNSTPTIYEEVPLIKLAYGRSGDKGDTCNIGIICRNPIFYNILKSQLTEESVAKYLDHIVKGNVVRYELPGIYAFNFVCTLSLGGGGLSSMNMDRQGKSYAQILLDFPIKLGIGYNSKL